MKFTLPDDLLEQPNNKTHQSTPDTPPDDATVITDPKTAENDSETTIFTVIWRFYQPNDTTTTNKHHATMLQMLREFYPNETITYIDNHQTEVADPNEYLQHPMKFRTRFRVHNKTMTTTTGPITQHVIVHRLSTTLRLSDIKTTLSVELRQFNCSLRRHLFDDKHWNIPKLGFLSNINSSLIPQELATERLQNQLQSAHPATTIPDFKLVPTRIVNGDNESQQTYAYEVQTLPKDEKKLTHMLINSHMDEVLGFVPYSLRKTDREVFSRCIRNTQCLIANQWVIKLGGLTPTNISNIRQHLLDIEGIDDVIPTYNSSTTGMWNVLTSKFQIVEAYNSIEQLLTDTPYKILSNRPFRPKRQPYVNLKSDTNQVYRYATCFTPNKPTASTKSKRNKLTIWKPIVSDDNSAQDLPDTTKQPTDTNSTISQPTTEPSEISILRQQLHAIHQENIQLKNQMNELLESLAQFAELQDISDGFEDDSDDDFYPPY